MRSIRWIVLVFGLAPVLPAQPRHGLSVFFSDANAQYHPSRGYGLAFDERWTPRFSTRIAAGVERPTVCVGGRFLEVPCTEVRLETHPVDLTARYHFVNQTRWQPYFGAGIRYLPAPHLSSETRAALGHSYPDHVSPQVAGGVELILSPPLALTAEGLGRITKSDGYDPNFKVAVGVKWRF